MTEPVRIRRNPAAHDHSKDEEGSTLRPKKLYLPEETYGSVSVNNLEENAQQQVLQQIQKETGAFSSRSNLKSLLEILGWDDVPNVQTLEQRLGFKLEGSVEGSLDQIYSILTKMNIFFFDSFNRPDSNDVGYWWENTSNYVIRGGKLLQAQYGIFFCITGEDSWDDYVVYCKLYPSSSDAYRGIVARYVDQDNFYALRFATNQLQILRRLDGSYSVLASTPFTYDPFKEYVFKFEVKGSRLKGQVLGYDEELIAEDNSLPNGRAGIYYEGFYAHTYWDDFLVISHLESIHELIDRTILKENALNRICDTLNYFGGLERIGNTITSDGTEQTLFVVDSPTYNFKPKVLLIDMSNMESGDEIVIRTYYRIKEGGSYILHNSNTYSGVQSVPLKSIDLLPNRFGIKVTLQQTSGSYKSYDYEIYYEA